MSAVACASNQATPLPPAPSATAVLPERPRLLAGCDWFECREGLVVRSVRGALCLEGLHSRQFSTLLPRLDGQQELAELLLGWRGESAFYALRALDLLAQLGVLAEGPEPEAHLPQSALDRLEPLRDRKLCLLHDGPLARALGVRLRVAGAHVTTGSIESARSSQALAIACPDGPALNELDDINAICQRASLPWVCVLPCGDGVLTSPRLGEVGGPCFRCLELRWLGRSQTVAWECAYWAALRARPDLALQTSDSGRLEQIAALVLPLLAERVVRSSSGSARLALSTLEPCESRQSKLLAHPQCEACSSTAPCQPASELTSNRNVQLAFDDWLRPPRPLSELALVLEPMAEAPCGLAHVVGLLTHGAASPPLHVVLAQYAFPEPETVGIRQSNWCHGAAPDARDARTLAIVEALERYTGLAPPLPGLHATHAELGDRALLPTLLPLFSPAQYARPHFPFQPFHPERELRWSRGYNLTRRREVWVPTSAVWYGYDDSLLGECSSGVAAHSSRGSALLNGALELIERDAFMIHWLHRIVPPRVPIERLNSEAARRLASAVTGSGYELHVLDLTTDLQVPVRLAIGVRDDGQKPALRLGAGADLDGDRATEKALKELYAATLSATPRWQLPAPLALADVRRLDDHARAYEHPAWLERAAFLWSSGVRSTERAARVASDLPSQLAAVLDRLGVFGHELIGVDMTGPDVASQGIHVLRAIVPGLQPLAFGPGPRLGGTRLFEAPVRMKARASRCSEQELYLVPHCFP
jgi:ribosomal protein S12 methylthiotransferase accessory factor